MSEREQLEALGYRPVKQLASGVWIGCLDLLYTCALCVGLSRLGYEYRYCYELRVHAAAACEAWDGAGDPPGPWVKLKGHPTRGECRGPGALDSGPWDRYEIIHGEDGATAIRCKRCGITSYNAYDVAHRYCGHCHVFHEDARA